MRICSLLPGATEIAFALGLGEQIVGVTHECDFPPDAQQKPVMVHSAIDAQRMSGLPIGQQLVVLGRTEWTTVLKALASQNGVPGDVRQGRDIKPELRKTFKYDKFHCSAMLR